MNLVYMFERFRVWFWDTCGLLGYLNYLAGVLEFEAKTCNVYLKDNSNFKVDNLL
jgi:hypothetical protein